VSLKTARNYACDGCYEPIIPGETDFSLAYVALLQVLEMSINHGSTFSLAGVGFLEGVPQSLPTAHPEEIISFEQVSVNVLAPSLKSFSLRIMITPKIKPISLLSCFLNVF